MRYGNADTFVLLDMAMAIRRAFIRSTSDPSPTATVVDLGINCAVTTAMRDLLNNKCIKFDYKSKNLDEVISKIKLKHGGEELIMDKIGEVTVEIHLNKVFDVIIDGHKENFTIEFQ